MEIHIHPAKKLSEIQEEFHKTFHWLKIEFFAKTHDTGAPSAYSLRLDPSLTVMEAGKFFDEKDMKVTGHTTVKKLETDFQEIFGIGVQVFRRAGSSWIQTTSTDDWTLARQNEEGHEDSKAILDKEE